MTCLHHSFHCENDKTFKLLVSKGANPDLEDEDGDTGRLLAEDNPKFKNAFSIVNGPELAISMSKS